jgi:hypothetical protein
MEKWGMQLLKPIYLDTYVPNYNHGVHYNSEMFKHSNYYLEQTTV